MSRDHDRGLVHSFATLPDHRFLRMSGTFTITRHADRVSDDRPQRNKALVLDAMTSLFQRPDGSAVERLYAHGLHPALPRHSTEERRVGRARRRPVAGRLLRAGLIVADGDLAAIHGRIRGWADTPQVAGRHLPDRGRQARRALGRVAERGAGDERGRRHARCSIPMKQRGNMIELDHRTTPAQPGRRAGGGSRAAVRQAPDGRPLCVLRPHRAAGPAARRGPQR